ncbi:MAG: type II toxin-antitoxin system RelE/ParE family toxin [Thermoguttaceae bacterium]|jgi:toxin ParE1/3/4
MLAAVQPKRSHIARLAVDSMCRYVISPAAERDMQSILEWTHERFGQQGRLRYEALLVRAIVDVADDPERAGSQTRPEIAPAARTYHLWYSRDRVQPASDRVRRPRHFLLYRIRDDRRVEIGRVLHERMDLARHLPDDYGPRATGGHPPKSP